MRLISMTKSRHYPLRCLVALLQLILACLLPLSRTPGVGVFVSRVEMDGAAWAAGLRPGDLLLGAGQAAFSALTHRQVIQVSAGG